MGTAYSVEGGQASDDLAFVVGRAPCEQLAVAHLRLERRSSPQVERLGGLYIIVVVKQQRARREALSAPHNHGSARCGQKLRAYAMAFEHLRYQAGALLQALMLGRHARLGAQANSLRYAFIQIRLQVSVYLFCVVRHCITSCFSWGEFSYKKEEAANTGSPPPLAAL
jgi:hypothetical protein